MGATPLTDAPEREPDSVPLSEIISLQRKGAGPLPATRAAADTLFALLPLHASNRAVTFRTTLGSFDFTALAKEYKTSAQPDSVVSTDHLVARAILRSDTVPGTTTVSASVGDYTTYITIPIVHP
jgi:hypothetical protein